MGKKKKASGKSQEAVRKAVAASVARANERAKAEPVNKLESLSKTELIAQMGTATYELLKVQDQIAELRRQENALQNVVRVISNELNKRG